jgi:hypothetical protein
MKFESAHQFQLLSPLGARFFIAKLAANKILSKTLKDYCPEKKWQICKISNKLDKINNNNPEFFLWSEKSPFVKGGLLFNRGQINEISLYAIKRYPLEILKESTKDTIKLLKKHKDPEFRSVSSILVFGSPFKINLLDTKLFFKTRQYKKLRLPTNPLALDDRILTIALRLSAVLIALICLYKREQRLVVTLMACLLFILINDFITASISGPLDRYHLRVLWLLPYVLIIISLKYLTKTVSFKKKY